MNISMRALCQMALGFLLFCTMVLVHAQVNKEFCWKDSYGRGVGTIPTSCGTMEYDAGLCYNKCPAGYYGVGPLCWSYCPAGYIDHGAICHIDKALMTSLIRDGCSFSVFGECIVPAYRCPSGYINLGAFCGLESAGKSPPAPTFGSYLDPMKHSYGRGVGVIPTDCGRDKEYDWGLCYDKCKAGMTGVGPVCWGLPPPTWVACGMGAAKDSLTCGLTVFNQVQSAGNLAMTVATAGTSMAATSGLGAVEKAARLAGLQKQYAAMVTAYQAIKKAGAAYEATDATIALVGSDKPTEEDIARVSAQIAALVDPTGVADVVAAYTYPTCSKYFGVPTASGSPGPMSASPMSASPMPADYTTMPTPFPELTWQSSIKDGSPMDVTPPLRTILGGLVTTSAPGSSTRSYIPGDNPVPGNAISPVAALSTCSIISGRSTSVVP